MFIILFLQFEKLLRKWLGVEKRNIAETSGKNVERRGRGIILLIFLFTLPIVITEEGEGLKWYWIFYLMVSLGFQSFVEWKYLKDSKEYVITLIFLLLCIIIMYNINYFFNY
jgi:hypothetical protein